MTVRSPSPTLSPRRRAALRLDLEDRQATLITELYSLSLRHCPDDADGRERLPGDRDWRLELAAPTVDWDRGSPEEGPPLVAVHGRLERLYAVNRALARLETEDYGLCARCGRSIDFDILAGDPVRVLCGDCSS